MAMTTDFEEETGADELGPWLLKPHDFQVDGFLKTVRALDDEGCRSALCVMPTGAGKSFFAMMVARWVIEDLGGRVLFIAHTTTLVEQACNAAPNAGLKAAVEQADQHARPDFTVHRGASNLFGEDPLDPKLVVATVQTMQGRRLKCWPAGHFDLIIVDECHHAEAATYRNVIDHLQPRWLVGVTATADRGDGKPIVGKNQVFERLTHEVFLHDLVRRGFLKRPVAKVLDTSIDLRNLRVTGAKDLNEYEVEQALLPHVAEIVNELREKLAGHRAVIFTPMVVSAEAVASAFGSVGISCLAVSGEDDDRAQRLAAFRSGEYQHVACSLLLTEGWDEPFVDSAVMLRATKSRALYCQMAGRALRKYAGKPNGYIWGVNWQTLGHDLVHPVQIFDSPSLRINPETVAGAQALVDSGEEIDLAAALKRAQAERKERRRIQLRVKEQAATATEYTFDPLNVGAVEARQNGGDPVKYDPLATERQVERLIKLGIDPGSAVNWSKKRASGFIGAQIEASKAGLCTYKQQLLLRKLGHPSPARLKFAEASAEIERLKSARGAMR